MLCLGLCYTWSMPNAPKTPTRTIRVPDELWIAAQKKAAEAEVTVTAIVLAALKYFVEEGLDKPTE